MMSSKLFLFCAFLALAAVSAEVNDETHNALLHAEDSKVNLYVYSDSTHLGNNTFTSIQAAINAVPVKNTHRYVIHIGAGTYREKIKIPVTKDFITLKGHGIDSTTIVFNGTPQNSRSTFNSCTVAIESKYFIARDVTFKNDAPWAAPGVEGSQAVAVRASGDMAAFYSCKFVSGQDTVYSAAGRHYFKDCIIEGATDFIFGAGRALYKRCDFVVNANRYGAVSAQGRANTTKHTSGFSIVNSKIYLGDGGKANRTVYLGRAWFERAEVVFSNTKMDHSINPKGWFNMGFGSRNFTSFFAEYNSFGSGADPKRKDREPWSHLLTKEQAKPFLSINYVNGKEWLLDANDNDRDIPELKHHG